MNENKIIETLKYISQFVKNGHDEGLGDYLHIVIGRTDINVIDETIHLLERKQKEIEELKEKNKNLIFQLKDEEKELIEVTDKIREKINYYRKYCGYDGVTMIGNTQLKELEELLEEN